MTSMNREKEQTNKLSKKQRVTPDKIVFSDLI